uniref:Uncharacterized protein n=1 Tax=Zea mays TaxID=4577 RepID=C4J0Y1_MAIZE|nr:unknown [Zea mays]
MTTCYTEKTISHIPLKELSSHNTKAKTISKSKIHLHSYMQFSAIARRGEKNHY